MSKLNTDYFSRCINTLKHALDSLNGLPEDDKLHDIYRAACVKEFEIILEQSGKLLKKCLKPYFPSSKKAERWLTYRDNRNETAHDYEKEFANETMALLPQFIQDSYKLNEIIQNFEHQ